MSHVLNDAEQQDCISQPPETCLVAFQISLLLQVLVLSQGPKIQPKSC